MMAKRQPRHEDIPGFAEAYALAQTREQIIAALAWADEPVERIAGVMVRDLTGRDYLRLQLLSNPLVLGGPATLQDCAVYLQALAVDPDSVGRCLHRYVTPPAGPLARWRTRKRRTLFALFRLRCSAHRVSVIIRECRAHVARCMHYFRAPPSDKPNEGVPCFFPMLWEAGKLAGFADPMGVPIARIGLCYAAKTEGWIAYWPMRCKLIYGPLVGLLRGGKATPEEIETQARAARKKLTEEMENGFDGC